MTDPRVQQPWQHAGQQQFASPAPWPRQEPAMLPPHPTPQQLHGAEARLARWDASYRRWPLLPSGRRRLRSLAAYPATAAEHVDSLLSTLIFSLIALVGLFTMCIFWLILLSNGSAFVPLAIVLTVAASGSGIAGMVLATIRSNRRRRVWPVALPMGAIIIVTAIVAVLVMADVL